MTTKTRKARHGTKVRKSAAGYTPAELRRQLANYQAAITALEAQEELSERLQGVAAHWHARVTGIVEALYDSVHGIDQNLADGTSPLCEYLDRESVRRVSCCLDQASTALMTLTPRERLDLPRPLALLAKGVSRG
jgi:hypothetical protein